MTLKSSRKENRGLGWLTPPVIIESRKVDTVLNYVNLLARLRKSLLQGHCLETRDANDSINSSDQHSYHWPIDREEELSKSRIDASPKMRSENDGAVVL